MPHPWAKLFRIWKTCHQAHKQNKYPYASFVCTLQVRFILSQFPIVSVAVWITVFDRFDRCLNLFESTTKHWSTGAKLFRIWNFLSAAFFGIREWPSMPLWFFILFFYKAYYSSTRHIILVQGILFCYKAYYSATRRIILLQGMQIMV